MSLNILTVSRSALTALRIMALLLVALLPGLAHAKSCQAWTVDEDNQAVMVPIFMAWDARECQDLPGYAVVWNRTNECMYPMFDGVERPKIMESPNPVTGRSVYRATITGERPVACLSPGEKVSVVLPYTSGWFSGQGYKTPLTQAETTIIANVEFRLYNVRVGEDGDKHIVPSKQTTVCDQIYYGPSNMSVNGAVLIEFQYSTGCHLI